MPECIPCYKDYISCGNTELMVVGTLTPDTDYAFLLENKGAKYTGVASTNDVGNFTIIVADLPDGLFNPYAGPFNLTVYSDSNFCDRASWNDSAYCDPYDCIQFEVKNGSFIKNTLGCPCP